MSSKTHYMDMGVYVLISHVQGCHQTVLYVSNLYIVFMSGQGFCLRGTKQSVINFHDGSKKLAMFYGVPLI